jgi:hypothetical protein
MNRLKTMVPELAEVLDAISDDISLIRSLTVESETTVRKHRRRVVLPHPDGPMKELIVLSFILRLISFKPRFVSNQA